jgi:DNA-binding transcriptional MerR regulator
MMPGAVYRGGVIDRKPINEDTRFLTHRHLQRMCGVTNRSLQYWDEKGIVSPRIHRHTRYYDRADCLLVLVLRFLRDRVMPIDSITRVTKTVRRELAGGRILPGSMVVTTADTLNQLCTDDSNKVIEFAVERRRGVFVIPVGQFLQQIDSELKHALVS